MRDVSIGEGQIPEETYEHSHTQFIKKIENTAKETGVLKGAYAISFHHPMAASRFRQIKRNIRKQLLQYIKRTRNLPTSTREIIRYEQHPVCYIAKLHNELDAVYETFSDSAWVESPEVTDLVCDLLQAVVIEKKKKLLAKGETDPSILIFPKILLLLNTYAFADRTMYLNCVQQIHSLEFFHSFFLIWGDGSCSFLYTGDENWAKAFH
jgi:hypothetical protein